MSTVLRARYQRFGSLFGPTTRALVSVVLPRDGSAAFDVREGTRCALSPICDERLAPDSGPRAGARMPNQRSSVNDELMT